MTLEARITRLPRAYEPDRAQEARAAVPWAGGALADLIAGTGGSSPYLAGLIAREGDWLQGAVDNPSAALRGLMADLSEVAPEALPTALRQGKRRMALLVGLCDLGGAWPLSQVTGALSEFADHAAGLALRAALRPEIRRGRIPGMTEDDLDTACGMVVLAMGKMGAGELNYSSDIDLICLFDETRFDPSDFQEARAGFVKATRRMAATLNDITAEGYVFRTDLRLRPDPSVTPVCIAMEAAERYYESLGRTWERAAYIKARPAAGDLEAGARFLRDLTPFVWRKHLDFAAIKDTHDMMGKIRDHRGLHSAPVLEGHNMKLGRGGIRTIEFFTQTRQLIAGGRDPDLRVRGTVAGLDVLSAKGWIPRDVAERLSDHYEAHRTVEHRIQMVQDAQTHALPTQADGFDRLACLMGTETETLRRDLRTRLTEVHELTEGFFANGGAPRSPACDIPEVFADHPVLDRWPRYPALRSSRAVEIFDRLKPEILTRLAGAPRPEEALLAFDGFLAGLPAGVQLFSLFDANAQLIDLLIDIIGTSPDLARHLARNSSVFDAVIGGDFFAPWPGREPLRAQLADRLTAEADYERALDTARRWGKEWHFRIGVHLLRGLVDAEEAGRAYADLAEATLAAVYPRVEAEFAKKHGTPPGRGAVVLGMGSLGAGRLHARSDLDVIVIYDPEDAEMSEGRRPLAARQYYARLTQALITAMTAPTAEGKLYEVDMRLRPSGNQGPVATSWKSFQAYQTEEAWVWEHLALTRARVVAGHAALAQDVESFRKTLLAAPRDRAEVLGALSEMLDRIAAAKRADPWDAKLGRGRMQEIELLSQCAALLSGRGIRQVPRALAQADWLSDAQRDALISAYRLQWALQIGARLISEAALDPSQVGQQGCAFLSRLTEASDTEALGADLAQRSQIAADIIETVLTKAKGAA